MASSSPTASERRPNVIWVFGDQHRAQALSHRGDPNLATPNVDRLAVEGANFTAAVAGCPLCCPFRGSMLTGVYPHRCVPGHEMPLPQGQKTLAHAFNDAGYQTAYFGKWHVDGFHEGAGRAGLHVIPRPRRGGFDTWIGYENNNSQWDCWTHGHRGEVEQPLQRLPGFETDALTDLFLGYLREQARDENRKPFFAALSVQPPHNPYVAPEQWMAKHTPATIEMRPNVPRIARIEERARRDLAGYYAMIENLDWNLGRVRSALVELGLDDDTHVIFFSDHGDMHGSHGQFLKTSAWEEASRVPFIIGGRRSFYVQKTGRNNAPINHVDIAPTTLGLCGIDTPSWMQGTDYSGYRVRGREVKNEPDSAFMQLVIPTGHGDSIDRPWRGVVSRDGWKYVCLEHQPWLLFNLNEDPFEQANLAHNTNYRVERKKLHDRLAAWIHDTGDSFPLPAL